MGPAVPSELPARTPQAGPSAPRPLAGSPRLGSSASTTSPRYPRSPLSAWKARLSVRRLLPSDWQALLRPEGPAQRLEEGPPRAGPSARPPSGRPLRGLRVRREAPGRRPAEAGGLPDAPGSEGVARIPRPSASATTSAAGCPSPRRKSAGPVDAPSRRPAERPLPRGERGTWTRPPSLAPPVVPPGEAARGYLGPASPRAPQRPPELPPGDPRHGYQDPPAALAPQRPAVLEPGGNVLGYVDAPVQRPAPPPVQHPLEVPGTSPPVRRPVPRPEVRRPRPGDRGDGPDGGPGRRRAGAAPGDEAPAPQKARRRVGLVALVLMVALASGLAGGVVGVVASRNPDLFGGAATASGTTAGAGRGRGAPGNSCRASAAAGAGGGAAGGGEDRGALRQWEGDRVGDHLQQQRLRADERPRDRGGPDDQCDAVDLRAAQGEVRRAGPQLRPGGAQGAAGRAHDGEGGAGRGPAGRGRGDRDREPVRVPELGDHRDRVGAAPGREGAGQ